MNRLTWVIVLLGIACCSLVSEALVVKGHLKTSTAFTTLGRFTFTNAKDDGSQSKDGIWVTYTTSKASPLSYLGFTYDALHINTSDTCINRMRRLSDAIPIFADGQQHKENVSPRDTQRPHVWSVLLVNCPMPNGTVFPVDLQYTIEFRNIDGSQVGHDEQGILSMSIAFLVLFFILALIHGLGNIFLIVRNSFHFIVKLFFGCLLASTFALLLQVIHWAVYSSNGIGCKPCTVIGSLFENFAYIGFVTLLVMIASGWAITYRHLQRKWLVLAIFIMDCAAMLLMNLAYVAVMGKGAPAALNTDWEYLAGYPIAMGFNIVYLFAWIVTALFFCYVAWRSYQEERQFDKRVFYMIFSVSFFFWLVIVPVFGLLALGLDPWVRNKVNMGLHLTITLIGYTALVGLLWPSRIYNYFRAISPDILFSDVVDADVHGDL